jgi:hypothetical protein
MTTREALAAMTDAGEFESLATAILRSTELDCRAVIHHGINASGKPVNSSVDAWCQVPLTNPPRFVQIQHTTTAHKKLRVKWLGPLEGDLVKSAAQAAELRIDFPAAKFRLFLTTNLVPSGDLQADVYKAAAKLGLEAVIVDQSRLADHLDKPEGQYLRRNSLGIEADSLSKDLLAELCEKSVALHAQAFLSGDVTVRVERETDQQLKAALFDRTVSLHYLVADPGFGKSTTAQRALSKHIATGGCGLWLSESLLAGAASLDDAINRTLCALHPALSRESAAVWRAHCTADQLLVVVDDVNRASNRTDLLQKLQGWMAPSENLRAESSNRQRVIAVCPVWTHVWEAARNPAKNLSWVRVTSLGSMEPVEGTLAILELAKASGRNMTRGEANECAEALNHDPYLIGIFGVLLCGAPADADPRKLTKDVIYRYVNYMLVRAASRSNGAFTTADLQEALAAMTTQMLLRKDLRPHWSKLRGWLKESTQSPVPEAAEFLRSDAVICRLIEGDILVFRHDRLMQSLLSESLSNLLDSEEVVSEVHYAEILGQTLATAVVSREQLERITTKNPLALLEALRAIGTPSTPIHRSIIEAIIAWVRRPDLSNDVPEALLIAIGSALMETDSLSVLEITRYLPPAYSVLAADLRNGDAWAGVNLLGGIGRVTFEPGIRNSWRDRVLSYAFQNHRQKLVTETRGILLRDDLNYEQSLGSLLLAGYLCAPELASEITRCFRSTQNNWRLLPAAVWAVGRCNSEQMPGLLDELFEVLESVSGEKDENNWSARNSIARAFSDIRPDAFPREVLTHIIRVAGERPLLQDVLFPLIHSMDSPDALEHLARHKAAQVKARGKTEVSSLDFSFSRWASTNTMGYVRPSEASRARLRALWQSDSEDEVVRSAAFKIWCWSADAADISHLKTVSASAPLFHSALWYRAILGDRSCIPDLVKCLREEPWLANIAHHVWSSDLFVVVDDWLARFADDKIENRDYVASCFGPLLTHIPPADGEWLLKKHWPALRREHEFVQAALLIATDTTIELADEAVRADAVTEPFAHLAMRMNDLRQTAAGWSVARFLRRLEPYLDRLSQDELWLFPLDCRWAGEAAWCRKHIMPRLSEEKRRNHYADDVAITDELEAIANDNSRECFPQYAIERLLRNEAEPRRIIELATAAFDSAPSVRRYAILAESVAEMGSRLDLALLKRPFESQWAEAAEKMRANTEFRVRRRTLS